MKLNKNTGITLIALVVTIIVLLILAGITLSLALNSNGIISRTKQATELSEMSQIKERGEMAKLGLEMDKWETIDIMPLKRNAVISAIHKEFEGSKTKGNKVTTADGVWDIIVKDNLSIEVIKHKEATGNKTIAISFGDVQTTESKAIILTTVVDVIIDGETIPTIQEYGTQLLEETTDEEEVKRIVVEGYNYCLSRMYEKEGMTLPDSEKVTWEKITYGLTYQEFITEIAPMYIEYGIIGQPGYSEQYGTEVTITCNGEEKTIDTSETSTAEFVILKNSKYDVIAETEGKSVTEIANVTECKTEVFSEILDDDTNKNYVMVTSKDNKQVPVPKGFAYGTSNNVGTVDSGFVITDKVENGESTGNEFVWIPVETAVSDTEANGTTNKAMAVKIEDNYIGLLYIEKDITNIESQI